MQTFRPASEQRRIASSLTRKTFLIDFFLLGMSGFLGCGLRRAPGVLRLVPHPALVAPIDPERDALRDACTGRLVARSVPGGVTDLPGRAGRENGAWSDCDVTAAGAAGEG